MTQVIDFKETDIISENDTNIKLQKLHSQLEKLLTYHQPVLKKEDTLKEIEQVLKWVEDSQDGSVAAEQKLYGRAPEVLCNIKQKIHLGMEEQQRIIEESPAVASNSKGREAERYAKASGRVDDALSTLTGLTDSFQSKN